MRKLELFLMFLTLIACNTIYSQWETNEYVDEFGDKTGKTYESLVASGTFSNSETEKSKADYAFIKNDNSLIIKVYEYSTNLTKLTDITYETVKIKQPDNEVVAIEDVFFTKKGELYFTDDKFTKITSALTKTGKYTIIFDKSGRHFSSSYKIELKL